MKNGEQSIHIITDSINNEYISGGLTKREYFAAMAMQGFVVNRYAQDQLDREKVAKWCIQFADEILNQLGQ